jgi:hypothetical protein
VIIDLRVDMGLDTKGTTPRAYRVRLKRITKEREAQVLLEVPYVAVSPEGEIRLAVHSGALEHGDYRVEVEAEGEPAELKVLRLKVE